MSALELPIRQFLEDFCSRAFPGRDFSRGSATSDLLIKPMAALLQPLRHEIDAIKLGQSVENYLYLTTDQMDALAANWGYFRQTGSRSFGTVTLYFRQPQTVEYTSLQFVSDDGVTFVLQAPVRITAAQMLAGLQQDGTYAADVPVVSVGSGSRYIVPAGSINTLRDRPAAIVRVENLADFSTTAPNESNYDVVNGMFRTLGLKNLVSRQSIRAPLFETFPGLLSVVCAGAGHPKMTRDLLQIPNGAAIHTGGCVDVWVNTRTLASAASTISYLPSTHRVRLVSANQALLDEAKFTFTSLAGSTDGRIIPTSNVGVLDESVGFIFDRAGMAYEAFVSVATHNGATALTRTQRSRGELIRPPMSARFPVVMDLAGPSFTASSATAGDTVHLGTTLASLQLPAGRSAVLGPAVNVVPGNAPTNATTTAAASRGDLWLSVSGFTSVTALDRVLVTGCPGAGWYRIAEIDSGDSRLRIANVMAVGTLAVADDTSLPAKGSRARYRFTPTDGTFPPVFDGGMPWLKSNDVTGLSAVPSNARVLAVHRVPSGVYLDVSAAASLPSGVTTSVIGGLRGDVPTGTPVFYERDQADPVEPAVADTNFNVKHHHTLFSSETISDLPVGASSVRATTMRDCGIATGDLILWDAATTTWSDKDKAEAGGIGEVYSSFVSWVSETEIGFVPPLPAVIPAETAFSVVRNAPRDGTYPAEVQELASRSVTWFSATTRKVTLSSWPSGYGTGHGFGLHYVWSISNEISAVSNALGVTFTSDAGIVVGATFLQSGTRWRIVNIQKGGSEPVVFCEQASGSGTAPIANDVVTMEVPYVSVVTESPLGRAVALRFRQPRAAVRLTLSTSGYVSPTPYDINRPVYQTAGSTTYVGILVDFDSSNRTWVVVPNDPAVDTFVASASVRVSGGTGYGTVSDVDAVAAHGYIAPTSSDAGRLVRQGPYTGTLYNKTDAFGDPTYTWYVIPNSESDLFDRLDMPVWIDRTTDNIRGTTEPFGYLAAPASSPLYTLDTPTFVVHDMGVPGGWTVAPSSVDILPRYPRSGAYVSASKFFAGGVPSTAFSNVAVETSAVVLPQGESVGQYRITAEPGEATHLLLDTIPASIDVVPTGARVYSAIAPSAAIAGSTTVTVPNTNIGDFAYPGRLLRIRIGTATYRVPITGRVSSTTVSVAPLPVTLQPTVPAEIAVIDGALIPYYITRDSHRYTYRSGTIPLLGTELPLSGTGALSSTALVDGALNIDNIAKSTKYLDLYIDSSAYASLTPVRTTDASGSTYSFPAGTFPSTAVAAEYHVVYRPVSFDQPFSGLFVGNQIKVAQPLPVTTDFGLHVLVNGERVTIVDFDFTTQNGKVLLSNIDVSDHPASIPEMARVSCVLIRSDRSSTYAITGTALYTYNYYTTNNFMKLPVARITSVQELDPDTFSPIRDLSFSMEVIQKGLRYSANEVNDLVIHDASAPGVPLRIAYDTDATIAQIDEYLNRDDTKVLGTSFVAKRAESLEVELAITLRSAESTATLQQMITQYIETLDIRTRLTKAGIIKFLYDSDVVSYVDVSSFILRGKYYQDTGDLVAFEDASDVYGAETAAYLAGAISVTKLD